MGLGSQASKAVQIGSLTGLTHDIFVGDIQPQVRVVSPTSQLFLDAPQGSWHMEGQNMKFAVDVLEDSGALAVGTSPYLPDHVEVEPVQGYTSPVRRFRRIAVDRHAERRAAGQGTFQPLTDRIFDQLWRSWSRMEIRHAIGGTRGILAVVSSRTSSTIVVLKDGYGHVGTNPLLHITENMILAWRDATAAYAAAGAGTVVSRDTSTNAVTMTTAGTWEPSATTAAGDYIVAATTPSISGDYFVTEYNGAPHGVWSLVDPDAVSSTVLAIAETNVRWKPYRVASATFDQFEVTEWLRSLRAKSTDVVNQKTHILLSQGGPVAQLARTLSGFQQQLGLGETFKGGYQALTIAGFPIIEDDYFPHDVMVALCREDLYRVTLGGEADFVDDDGSEKSRVQDADMWEAYVGDAIQHFCPRRNRHAALTGITLTDVDATDFDPVAV